jgi:hypothetical protein
VPEIRFTFNPATWERLSASGVAVLSVLHVLYRTR